MKKSKLCSFVIATAIGSIAFAPTMVSANDNTGASAIVSEVSNNSKDTKASFDQKIKKADEAWKALTDEQRNEIYAMLEDEVNIELNVLNKLVEYGILEKLDAEILSKHLLERFESIKNSDEFPLFKKNKNNRKGH